MKIKLLNSAMMPKEGVYFLKRIDKQTFIKKLIEAYETNCLENYIGYQENLDFIYAWTGILLFPNRTETNIEDGDFLLIMKLKYRLKDPNLKGKLQLSEKDFEFFICEYKSM